MIVVGPGVAPWRTELVRLTTGLGATVVNTVGAKGLFPWDSPFHGGTVGLQVGDADLAELGRADAVVAIGVERGESESLAAALTARAAADDGSLHWLDAHDLPAAAAEVGALAPGAQPGARPPLYDALAAVVGPLDDRAGSAPSRGRALAEALPDGGLVVAPPGPAAFWVGRTFPTQVLGSVAIPIGRPPGAGAARAREAASLGRPVTVVLAERDLDGPDAVVLSDADVVVQVWPDLEGPELDALIEVAGEPDPAIWPGRPA